MPREAFVQDLQVLEHQVIELGSMVDKAIARSVEALGALDAEEARKIIHEDLAVNKKRFEIEEQALLLIATQQPMASDLRAIAAVLYIIVDLERIGDHAEGIAKIVIMHGEDRLLKPLIDVPRMAEKSRSMIRSALDALIARDAEAARKIADEDDAVDALYEQVLRELFSYMIEDPRTITRATYLMWVAHNLERIADRATNICERVAFMVTGRMEEFNVSKY